MLSPTQAPLFAVLRELRVLRGSFSDFNFCTGQHARKARADEERIIATGEPLAGAEECQTMPDGSLPWWGSPTQLPLRRADGTIVGIMGITRDITGHKRAEETPLNDDRTAVSRCKRSRRMSGNPQISFFASVGGAG